MFVVFIIDIPEKLKACNSFSYAHVFKTIANSKCELDYCWTAFEFWCDEIQLVHNVQKHNLLKFKSNLQASINGELVACQPTKKALGLIVASCLNWTENCH